MADASHKREFKIRDLSTRSVLLFPTRAQIIRDIKDIALQVIPYSASAESYSFS